MTEKEEAAYERGKAMLAREILSALPQGLVPADAHEAMDARRQLLALAEELGIEATWDPSLHVGDAIEKHFGPQVLDLVEGRVQPEEDKRPLPSHRALTDEDKDAVISAIGRAWKRCPHQRLGQLIINAAKINSCAYVFHVEDGPLARAVQEFAAGLEGGDDR